LAKLWGIVDRGKVPDPPDCVIDFTCQHCGNEAGLPVAGLAIAQIASGVVFDSPAHAMPAVIRCKKCRKLFKLGA
jgi:predicted RNA-binding Zn-ribbon protein involved in translation (DUF1610 family)